MGGGHLRGRADGRQVVLSTGYEGAPFTPDWSGRESFEGALIHAAEYRNPEAFAGMAVLVVGPELPQRGSGTMRM
jgi:cation diffusion facilitator CzcD-associated flavoprotein CzcO